MPLIPSVVPLRLGALDSKTDDRWGVPGNLTLAENVVFDNWPKLRKRPGSKKIADAGSGAQLAAYKDQLLVGTGADALSSTPSAGLVNKGLLESMSVRVVPAARDTNPKQSPDVAVHPLGITVATFESVEAGTVVARYTVLDSETGQPIISNVLLSSAGSAPKPIVVGNFVAIIYYDRTLTRLRYVTVPVADPTAPNAVADLALDPTDSHFDATNIEGNAVIAYRSSTSGKIAVLYLTPGLILSAATQTVTASATTAALSVFGDSLGNVWLAWSDTAGVYVVSYASDLITQRFAPVTVEAVAARNLCGLVQYPQTSLFYELSGASTWMTSIHWGQITSAGTLNYSGVMVRSVGLASKPFLYLSRPHVLVAFQTPLQPTYFLLSTEAATVVAKLAPATGGGLTARTGTLPEVSSVAGGVFTTAYMQADRVGAQAGTVFSQAGAMLGTFDFTARQSAVELSDDLHLSGGILSSYDGAQVVEHGFHYYPEPLAFGTAGGGGASAGQYQAVAVYEWMDAQGLIHQSAPSPVQTVTATAGQAFTYTIPTLRLTSKMNSTPVSIVVYRTQANGTVLYRVTPLSSPVLNALSTDTVTAPADTLTDAQLGGNAQLVFNPLNASAELPPLAAPAPLHVWRYRGRVCLIPAEQPFQWVYSKAFVPGVPIEFNDQNLYQAVAQDGGPLTCGIEMDEKNVLFTARRIYCVVGDGPAPNGTNPDYGAAPQAIPSDVGCVNPRSLVLTPMGVMFQSAKGIYLLGRNLAVSYIGDKVEAFNDLTITAAELVPNSRRVVFFTDGGVALVYDYYANKWAVWTNQKGADAAIFGGLLTHVQPGGALTQETPGAFTDDGQPILIGVATTILSFAGLSGFQRLYRVAIRGDYRGAHRLTLKLSFDDSPAPQQTETVDAGALLGTPLAGASTPADTETPGGGAYPAYDFVVKAARQRCSSVRLEIREQQVGPVYGEGCAISGVTFLVAGKQKLHPFPASRSV